LRTLTDLGYEGEAHTVVVAFNKPKNGELSDQQQTFHGAHNRPAPSVNAATACSRPA